MSKVRKVTKAEFGRFQKVFRFYQLLLGVPEYEVYFEQADIDAIAQIDRNVKGCVAVVKLNTRIPLEDANAGWVEETAKHEAIHLFLNRLMYLAKSRWSAEGEIDREEERITRILERII